MPLRIRLHKDGFPQVVLYGILNGVRACTEQLLGTRQRDAQRHLSEKTKVVRTGFLGKMKLMRTVSWLQPRLRGGAKTLCDLIPSHIIARDWEKGFLISKKQCISIQSGTTWLWSNQALQ